MAIATKSTDSVWVASTPTTSYPSFKGKTAVDVAIVGGGITGLTAALLLKKAGKTVAVLEKERIAEGESGRTTAHLTEIIDKRYHKLISDFGIDGARLACAASREAIDLIESLVTEYAIPCGFERVPAYLYSEWGRDGADLQQEFQACRRVGMNVEMTKTMPLPFAVDSALRFVNQAQFHPREYVLALAKKIPGDGSAIYENTLVRDIKDGEPCRIVTEDGEVVARDVIVATDSPISSRVFIHTKIAAYRTYVIGVRLKNIKISRALFWDTEDPYHYTRLQQLKGPKVNPPSDILIVGGEDHKVGMKADTGECFERLEEYTRARYPVEEVLYRWSGQIMESVDGLPYIGLNSMSDHVYVSTGYSGNGMTFGTIAARVLSDLILSRSTQYADLFAAKRIKPLSSLPSYLQENKDFPTCFLADRIRGSDGNDLESIAPGEGKIVEIDNQRVAVYVGYDGSIEACSPVCPHLGCYVHWNSAEKSWDCPCHGSRFSTSGHVLHGPSPYDLKPVAVKLEVAADRRKRVVNE